MQQLVFLTTGRIGATSAPPPGPTLGGGQPAGGDRSGKRDTTNYRFRGELLGKGRLVLSVVKFHASITKEPAYSNLEKAFPIGLQGSSGVILPASEAAKIFELSGRKRHFIEDDELVRLPGKDAAVSNQWGSSSITAFLNHAKQLGHEITISE